MSVVVWGLLTKSAEDATKIEEEIEARIATHNADPNAHGLADMALYAHRVGDVLDHIEASVKKIHLDIRAVDFVDTTYDKGEINDFTNFESAVTGSGSIEKIRRTNRVKTGATQNSVAKVYSIFRESGALWYCDDEIQFDFHIYIGEEWGWETAPGAEVYIKYGWGLNADMGSVTDKCFGFKIEDQATGYFKITGFARDGANLSTIVLVTDIDPTLRHVLSVLRDGSYYRFYIDGVLKGSVYRPISGAGGDPCLTHVIKNPVAGSYGENVILQIGFFFPFPL